MRSGDQSPPGFTLLTILSLALLVSAVIVFAFDLSYWLKYASWSAITLPDVFRYYGISEPYFVGWSGAQEIWGYLRNLPLSLLLLVIWFLFTTVAGSLFGSGMQSNGRGSGSGPGSRRRR
jgi:hypothetical protein